MQSVMAQKNLVELRRPMHLLRDQDPAVWIDGERAEVEDLVCREQRAIPLDSMSGPPAWCHLMCAASIPTVMLPILRSRPHTAQRYSQSFYSDPSSPLIACRRTVLALKVSTCRDSMVISSPVWGLRPRRAVFDLTTKLPNLAILMSSPLSRVAFRVSKKHSTASLASFLVMPVEF